VVGRGRGIWGKVAHTMYTHMNKYNNKKRKSQVQARRATSHHLPPIMVRECGNQCEYTGNLQKKNFLIKTSDINRFFLLHKKKTTKLPKRNGGYEI
jgi:hypothetical protein